MDRIFGHPMGASKRGFCHQKSGSSKTPSDG